MRLLSHDSAGVLRLTDFGGKAVPPYAILSHRWGVDEVLFGDLRGDKYKNKAGYSKIEFLSKQATKDDLEYFWIDTCCIDKWNVRELTNAINSMYSWYRDAATCYVYLSDVSTVTVPKPLEPQVCEDLVASSEWFTRGWTLQELLAPKSVDFFSAHGSRLGDRTNLAGFLSRLTGIPVDALQGCSLDRFSVVERTAWAAKRNTSEPEDSAYCLLGLLGMSMRIAYGEGKDRAMARLFGEAASITSPRSSIPLPRNLDFMGRDTELLDLEQRLWKASDTSVVTIAGASGSGKSQLALELAYIVQEKNPDCLVFCIDASHEETITLAYAAIAQVLNLPGWDDDGTDVRTFVFAHLSRDEGRQWLLVFDNADEMLLRSEQSPSTSDMALFDLVPKSRLGSVILTTCQTEMAGNPLGQNTDTVIISSLTLNASKELLKHHLDHRTVDDPVSTERLLRELHHSPLNIVLAANYIRNAQTSVAEYMALIATTSDGLPVRCEVDGGEYYASSVTAAIVTTSLSRIHLEHPLAAECLQLAACLGPRDIPIEVLAPTATVSERKAALGVLSSYGLVTRRPAESAMDIQRSVYLAIRDVLHKRDMTRDWTHRAIRNLEGVFPDADEEHREQSKWRRLVPHAKVVLSCELVGGEDITRSTLVYSLAMALLNDGQLQSAVEWLTEAVDIRQAVLGQDHASTLTCMANLAFAFSKQGRYHEAEAMETIVLKSRKRLLGDDHPVTLTDMANLASTYHHLARNTEAEDLATRTKDSMRRVLGLENDRTLCSIAILGSIYRNQGRWSEAEALESEVLEVRRRILGLQHPSTINSMSALASTYRREGRWGDAVKLQVEAVEVSKRLFGHEHPRTLDAASHLGMLFHEQGHLDDAERTFLQVLEASVRVLGPEHEDVRARTVNLAEAYASQSRWDEAQELFSRVLEQETRLLGPTHPLTLSTLSSIGLTHITRKEWADASDVFTRVTDGERNSFGPRHPSMLANMNNLALVRSAQGEWAAARPVQEEVVEMCRSVMGPEHPKTLTAINNLALTHSKMGNMQEAVDMFAQILEIRTKVCGREHPQTLDAMENLAFTLASMDKYHPPFELLTECARLSAKVLGVQHPDTVQRYKYQKQWAGAGHGEALSDTIDEV